MDLSGPRLDTGRCVACHVYQDGNGRWHWEGVDAAQAVVAHSHCAFDTRAECLADMLKHGHPLPLQALTV
jgi:hypothetical protein